MSEKNTVLQGVVGPGVFGGVGFAAESAVRIDLTALCIKTALHPGAVLVHIYC